MAAQPVDGDAFLAYMAGIFDGEGSVGVYAASSRRASYSLLVQIAQNASPAARKVWLELVVRWGGSVVDQPSSSGRTKMSWRIKGERAAQFLEDIQPWVRLKRAQVELALEWMSRRPPVQRGADGQVMPVDAAFLAYSQEVADALKLMKRDGEWPHGG